MGQPRPPLHLFVSFQTHITIFSTNRYVRKCPSSIQCRDSNTWPLEHESPPLTTRPGLSPMCLFFFSSPTLHFWKILFLISFYFNFGQSNFTSSLFRFFESVFVSFQFEECTTTTTTTTTTFAKVGEVFKNKLFNLKASLKPSICTFNLSTFHLGIPYHWNLLYVHYNDS